MWRSGVIARCSVAVVHAHWVRPAGNARLGLCGIGSGLCGAMLGSIGTLQAASGVAEVGPRPVVRSQAGLWSFLRVLHGGELKVLCHRGLLARAVERCLALLLLLLALLLVGLF